MNDDQKDKEEVIKSSWELGSFNKENEEFNKEMNIHT